MAGRAPSLSLYDNRHDILWAWIPSYDGSSTPLHPPNPDLERREGERWAMMTMMGRSGTLAISVVTHKQQSRWDDLGTAPFRLFFLQITDPPPLAAFPHQ